MKGVRLFLPSAEGPGGEIDLTAEQAHVLSRVLRLAVGEEVTLLDGQGGLRACELLALGKKSARVRVRAVEVAPRPKPDITLCYALPKGEKASEVIRRCVEWGVNRIIFLTSEFAVAKASGGQVSRWERVAEEAMRQSGNPFFPEFVGPLRLEKLVTQNLSGLKLVFDTVASAQPMRAFLSQTPDHISVAVGPEGGWAQAERKIFQEGGFSAVRVGPYVLRTENAAIGAVAMLRGLFAND